MRFTGAETTYRDWVRRGPMPSAATETVLTGGSACLWYALAMLLHLENQAHDPWDPDYPGARPFFLLAYGAGASLLLTWALRALPAGGRLRGILAGIVQLRAAAVCVVWLALVVSAIVT
ncbi:hypothetical protein [Streptomyces sp. T028]|uniref:hypothetical protein n=1 Tax=Streptomyces sp. T028 TaxID=3394379 RepID=UPI003A8AE82D